MQFSSRSCRERSAEGVGGRKRVEPQFGIETRGRMIAELLFARGHGEIVEPEAPG